MAEPTAATAFTFPIAARLSSPVIAFLEAAVALLVLIVEPKAQQAEFPPVGRVIVVGEGSISVAPDYAQIGSGVTSKAKSAKEATDANSKLMADVIKALLESGIAQKDIQTSRFTVQPIYESPEPRMEPKLAGYSVSNQVRVKIWQIDKVAEILDRLVTAGATNVGGVEFLTLEASKALDLAREAAIIDAKHKAETYAHASGIQLGRIEWIAEDSGFDPLVSVRARGGSATPTVPIPIATGEDALRVKVTVGFGIAR